MPVGGDLQPRFDEPVLRELEALADFAEHSLGQHRHIVETRAPHDRRCSRA
jgi:hypothetical protein